MIAKIIAISCVSQEEGRMQRLAIGIILNTRKVATRRRREHIAQRSNKCLSLLWGARECTITEVIHISSGPSVTSACTTFADGKTERFSCLSGKHTRIDALSLTRRERCARSASKEFYSSGAESETHAPTDRRPGPSSPT